MNFFDDPARQEHAAQLVSSLSEYLGNDEYFVDQAGSGPASTHLAHILSVYMPSVDNSLSNPLNDADHSGQTTAITDPRIGGYRTMPIFDIDELESLVHVAIGSPEGFTQLRTGVSIYENLNLAHSIATNGEITGAAYSADARLEVFFTKQVEETKIGDAEDADRRVQAWIDLGKDFAGAIPLPGASLVGNLAERGPRFLADPTIDQSADYFSDSYTNNEDHQLVASNEAAMVSLNERKGAIVHALYAANETSVAEFASVTGEAGIPSSNVARWFANGYPTAEAQGDLDRQAAQRLQLRHEHGLGQPPSASVKTRADRPPRCHSGRRRLSV